MSLTTPSATITPHSGYVEIAVSGGGTSAVSYKVNRSLPSVESLTLTKTLAISDSFFDYSMKARELYNFSISALDVAGNESAPTSAITAQISIASCFIHQVTKEANTNKTGTMLELFNQEGQKRAYMREGNILTLAVGGLPQVRTSPRVKRILEIPILIRNQDKAIVMPVLVPILRSNACFCYRDANGEKAFVTLPSQQIKKGFNYELTMVMWGTSYQESV